MGKYSKVEGKLIAEVERYPVLWRTKDINYKNKTVKENAWQLVADTVNRECDANFTGNKIEYLHSSFVLFHRAKAFKKNLHALEHNNYITCFRL